MTDTAPSPAAVAEVTTPAPATPAPATTTAPPTRAPRGTGKITCNGRDLEAYFPSKVHQQLIREPLVTSEKAEAFDVVANLRGGGITGQAGALRLGIARALITNDPDDRPALKKAGFLTRDARVKESKKYGLKKARKAPQYSKR
jgi:small subunit ribosomal protein S9